VKTTSHCVWHCQLVCTDAKGLYAAAVSCAVIVAMHVVAGTMALEIDCLLERCIRDLQTMERHSAAQPLW